MTRYLRKNELLDTKDNEFKSVAISLLWHEQPILCRGQINVAGIWRRYETWKKLCLKISHYCCIRSRRSVQFGSYETWSWMANCVTAMTQMLPFLYFHYTLPLQASIENVTLCARIKSQAVSDRVNPLSLGTVSTSAYIENWHKLPGTH